VPPEATPTPAAQVPVAAMPEPVAEAPARAEPVAEAPAPATAAAAPQADGEPKRKHTPEELAAAKAIARAYREKRLKEIDAQQGKK